MTGKKITARRCAGFTLTDLLVVVAVIAVMLSMQLATNASARNTARRMQNSTQLRGIHQGMVVYANANRNFFPGLNSRGEVVANGAETTGNSGSGDFIQARYWILLDGDFFTPDYAISPSETAAVTAYDWDREGTVLWSDRTKNYSYAFLGFQAAGANRMQVRNEDAPRVAEWSATLNSQAIVVSDRNTGTNATNAVSSIHTAARGDWAGSVLWNDNHVGFENEQFFETKYANGRLNSPRDGGALDNLFADEPAADGQIVGANALMTIADNNIVNAGE